MGPSIDSIINRQPHQPLSYAALLRALTFAAAKHRDQRRKGNHQAPYINHPIEVAQLVATVGGCDDVAVLQAAILHDTIEDTDATPEEIEQAFGADVCALVLEMTDDMSLPSAKRKEEQLARALRLSDRAKLIKIADKIANVGDIARHPPPDWTMERRRNYFNWTKQVVDRVRGTNPALEASYDEVLRQAREILADNR
jgi:guanosine-3',5'-bis(diphosphate) 3'-pyrophosphohydrolase